MTGRIDVLGEIVALERLCNEIELALRANDMPGLDRAIADSRRVMHAFENAMEAAAPLRDAAFDTAVYARLRKIFEVREGQMRRLQRRHDGLAERLQSIARWKEYARSIGAPKHNRERMSMFDDRR